MTSITLPMLGVSMSTEVEAFLRPRHINSKAVMNFTFRSFQQNLEAALRGDHKVTIASVRDRVMTEINEQFDPALIVRCLDSDTDENLDMDNLEQYEQFYLLIDLAIPHQFRVRQ